MSRTTSSNPASARTVFEPDARRSFEISRTVPVTSSRSHLTEASMRCTVQAAAPNDTQLALGTNPPSSSLDAHLIAIGTPPPGAHAIHAGAQACTTDVAPAKPAPAASSTVVLGRADFVAAGFGVVLAPKSSPRSSRASIAVALVLGVLALAIAPLAPIAWMHAAEQLDLIARGMRREAGKRWLHAVCGIGIAMTMVAVAATAFGITVMIARLM